MSVNCKHLALHDTINGDSCRRIVNDFWVVLWIFIIKINLEIAINIFAIGWYKHLDVWRERKVVNWEYQTKHLEPVRWISVSRAPVTNGITQERPRNWVASGVVVDLGTIFWFCWLAAAAAVLSTVFSDSCIQRNIRHYSVGIVAVVYLCTEHMYREYDGDKEEK